MRHAQSSKSDAFDDGQIQTLIQAVGLLKPFEFVANPVKNPFRPRATRPLLSTFSHIFGKSKAGESCKADGHCTPWQFS